MDSISMVPFSVVLVAALVVAVIDIRRFRIPNGLTAPLFACGVVFHSVVGGFAGLQSSLLGALFGFGILFVFYVVGATGAGDVKFMAATGAWMGIPTTVYVFAVAGIATAIYSTAILLWQGGLGRATATIRVTLLQLQTIGKHLRVDERVESIAKRDDRRKRLVPFAAMVAFGVIVVLLGSQFV